MHKNKDKLRIKPCKFKEPEDQLLEDIQEKLEEYFLR